MAEHEKRVPKCAGGSTPLSEHDWGIASKFCEGKEISSLRRALSPADDDINVKLTTLEEELAALQLDEERRAKEKRLASLQKQINDKRAELAAQEVDNLVTAMNVAGPSNVQDLRKMSAKDMVTPPDRILNPLNLLNGSEDPTGSTNTSTSRPSSSSPGSTNRQYWLECVAGILCIRDVAEACSTPKG